ncbi:AraC family transcriptional regulator [Jiangella asiatica]|uniref:AraC family transcriptional regulator n=1 Tax=Jiangella asiatica TaxID=2530372 RepID=A0A4V2Z0S6_9ACTN|nr:AraC family transcriptional regulator [Jiangella asiatica]TDE02198.1 AraC family transcriptional regulator [Jiangella asiatica]
MAVAEPWSPVDLPNVVMLDGPAQPYRGNVHTELKLVLTEEPYEITRREAVHVVPTGQLIVLHADEAHSGRPLATPSGRWRIICVPPAMVAEAAGGPGVRFDPPVVDDASAAKLFEAVFDLLEDDVPADERRQALVELVAALLPYADGARSGSAPVAIGRLREYLEQHRDRNVALDELAAVVGMSKYRMVRACTVQFGAAPHALHLQLRLDLARDLIRRGVPLADVAVATGFHDQPHLGRTFARAYGQTPAQYRAAWSGAGDTRKLAFGVSERP